MKAGSPSNGPFVTPHPVHRGPKIEFSQRQHRHFCKRNFSTIFPRFQRPRRTATSNKQPATSNQFQPTSIGQPTSSNQPPPTTTNHYQHCHNHCHNHRQPLPQPPTTNDNQRQTPTINDEERQATTSNKQQRDHQHQHQLQHQHQQQQQQQQQ